MTEFVVGVGRLTLHLRHAQSLKDKKRVLQSLVQKLRNEGFSVTEAGYGEEVKRGSIGYVYAGGSASYVKQKLEETNRLFIGDYLVVENQHDIVDYGGEDAFDENPFKFLADEED